MVIIFTEITTIHQNYITTIVKKITIQSLLRHNYNYKITTIQSLLHHIYNYKITTIQSQLHYNYNSSKLNHNYYYKTVTQHTSYYKLFFQIIIHSTGNVFT